MLSANTLVVVTRESVTPPTRVQTSPGLHSQLLLPAATGYYVTNLPPNQARTARGAGHPSSPSNWLTPNRFSPTTLPPSRTPTDLLDGLQTMVEGATSCGEVSLEQRAPSARW